MIAENRRRGAFGDTNACGYSLSVIENDISFHAVVQAQAMRMPCPALWECGL
ncbi:MAG: hypothetical protein JW811_02810 [Clostridiales bacterium]|nr:hypothetical protein [Clostridiales bacterium]